MFDDLIASLAGSDPASWESIRVAGRGHGAALLRFAGLCVSLIAAGRPVSRWLGTRVGAVRLSLSLGIFAAILHGFGLAGLWDAGLLRTITGLAALGGGYFLLRGRRRLPDHRMLAALIIPMALGFVLTRLPDTDDDPRTYHFAAPESYLREHKIHAEPLNVNWHMPLAASMLFGAGWAWDDIEGAKLVNLAALLALMLATAGLGERISKGSGPAAALLIGCTGLGIGQVWQGKDDLVLAAHAAVAVWAVCSGRWAVAAMSLGFAFAVKFTAGFFGLGLAAAAVILVRRMPIRLVPVLTGLLVAPMFGWLAASWLFVGNPVHPFLSSVFPDLGWGPEYQAALHRVMAILTGAGPLTWRDAAAGFWRAWGDPALGHPLLPVLAAAGVLAVRSPARWPLVAAVAAGYLLWLTTERNARYLFSFASILAAFGGVALHRWSSSSSRFLRSAGRLLSVVVLLVPVSVAMRLMSRDGLPLLVGRMGGDEYLARRFTTWDSMRWWVNVNLPVRSSLVFAGEERRLWFASRVRSGFTVHEPLLWRWSNDSIGPDRMRIKARQANASALVHNYMSGEFRSLTRFAGPDWTDRQLAVYGAFAGRWLRPVRMPDRMDRDGGGFIVSALEPAPAGTSWPVYHLPQTEGLAAKAWLRSSMGERRATAAERRAVAARLRGVMAANLQSALAAELEGDNAGVVAALAPAVTAGFVGVNALERYGAAALAMGRTREGLAAISRAWRLSHEDSLLVPYAFGLYQRALVHLKARRMMKAREDLLVAARLAPDQPAIRRALAGFSVPR